MLPVSGALQLNTSDDQSMRPHDLGQGGVLEIVQTRAVFLIGQEQIPESVFSRFRLQLLDDGRRGPAACLMEMSGILPFHPERCASSMNCVSRSCKTRTLSLN